MTAVATDVIDTLSAFEISLLMLSAYLHDIGMTPEFNKVQGHFKYLLTGESSTLGGDETAAMQEWLDNEGHELVPPISDSIPLAERLSLASELTAHYCRYRHNLWSAEWIRRHLSRELLGTYHGWLEDLILLCESHHLGYLSLKGDAFKPRWVGEPPAVVNLRFLALVLRIADILEFDPERTPDVIIRHRDIAPGSLIYWWKDKLISIKTGDQGIVVSARPPTAKLHKAVQDMVDAIDAELGLCRAIADEIPLGSVPGSGDHLSYRWGLPSRVHRDIMPREGCYEYIDGAFRPDTKKLLSLLSGTSLYQDPIEAVREVVQNAFDAVCERIAYQRLMQPNPSSSTLGQQLARQHRVSLRLETQGPDSYLVCTDDGIGMTKAIICDRVLVSGLGPRHEVRALDRRCKEAGFQLGRSGQFGIGILSYFMLATKVEIETRRAQEANDLDSSCWYFETEGVGSFGELRKKVAGARVGSQIRLRLRPELCSDLTAWYRKMRSYLVSTVLHCPCEFHVGSSMPGCEPLELEPGWCPHDFARDTLRRLKERAEPPTPVEVLSTPERERRIAVERERAELEEEYCSHLRWRLERGTLSGGLAEYVLEPYFDLEGGPSLGFLQARREGRDLSVHQFRGGTYYQPEGSQQEAWKGMLVHSDYWWRRNGALRLNWTSDAAGKILVHRNRS